MSRRDQIRNKIMSRVVIDEVTGCWLWTGPTSGDEGRGAGYPRMSLGGQTVAVHLVMWTNEHGYIPGRRNSTTPAATAFACGRIPIIWNS